MIHVEGQFVKFETVGDAILPPGLAPRLEPTQQQLARVFLGIDALFQRDQTGKRARDILGRFGDNVEMFRRM